MGPFLTELMNLCRLHGEQELFLLCPTLDVGDQWLVQLRRADNNLNLPKLTTIWQLAEELAQPSITHHELSLLLPQQFEVIVHRLWREELPKLPRRTVELFGTGTAVIQSIAATLLELRMAGLSPDDCDPEAFESVHKGKVLRTLLTAYEQYLQEHRLADPASVMAQARDRLIEEGHFGGRTLFIPDNVRFGGLMQSVLDQVPEDNRHRIPTTCRSRLPLFDLEKTDLARLRWLGNPQNAPPAVGDQSVRIYRALDPHYEVRAVLGTLLREHVPVDQAEVLTTNDRYPLLIYQALLAQSHKTLRNSEKVDLDRQAIPCTFASGVPAGWTHPGRALLLWIAWIRNKYRLLELRELLSQGLLRPPSPIDSVTLSKTLQGLSGCVGRETWRQRTTAKIGQFKDEASHARPWLLIQEWIEPLIALLPTTDIQPQHTWRAISLLLQNHVLVSDERDEALCRACLDFIDSQQICPFESVEAVWDRIVQWVGQTHLPGEAPQAGCLHVAPLMQGGHTGRPWTFIVGLTEGDFPLHIERDSLLTDKERGRLSPELASQTQHELLHKQESQFAHLLGQLDGQVIFTYPCADQKEDCELFPSPKLMQIFRLMSDLPEGDLVEMERWLPAPLGPHSHLVHLSDSERWLGAWPVEGIAHPEMAQVFLQLVQGAESARQRRQLALSRYDGWVPQAGALFDLERTTHVFSARALETLAKCPLRFFYTYGLKVADFEMTSNDSREWLTPSQRGQVLHDLFREYHFDLIGKQQQPHLARDLPMIQQMLQGQLRRISHELPIVQPHIQQKQLDQLDETLRIFLEEEVHQAGTSQAEYLEVSIGLSRSAGASGLDTTEPCQLRLPSGRTIHVQGRIDRIDRVLTNKGAEKHYFVWDYKTGKLSDYAKEESRSSGRLLQPLLYLEIAQARLRTIIDPEVTVLGVGYFFPGVAGHGDRIRWSAVQLREHVVALDRLADVLSQGVFLATDKKQVCAFCTYQQACDLSVVNEQSRRKLHYSANEMLEPLRRLRQMAGGIDEPS